MRLTTTQKARLQLLGRSPKDADGWSVVSALLWPLMEKVPADLVEIESDAAKGGRARFTEKGKIVHEYTL